MSDWKNPTYSSSTGRTEWKPPRVEEPDDQDPPMWAMKTVFIFRALFGFVLISSINAFFVYSVAHLLGSDIEYRKAVIVGALLLVWRAYDMAVFKKLNKGS